MPRARNLKPGFFKNEALAEQPFAARILFQGLWILADREGRLEDRPKRIKAEILPYDDENIEELLTNLARVLDADKSPAFIVRYEVNKRRYIQVVNFKKHQWPHSREPASTIPAPDSPSARPMLDQGWPGKGLEKSVNPCAATSTEQEQDKHSTGPVSCARDPDPLSPIPYPGSPIRDPGSGSTSLRREVCTERFSKRAAPTNDVDQTLLIFPTSGKGKQSKVKQWVLTLEKAHEYWETFGEQIDVLEEARYARQWCRDNKAKRKTAGGMPAFLARWFRRAVDSGKGAPPKSGREMAAEAKRMVAARAADEAQARRVARRGDDRAEDEVVPVSIGDLVKEQVAKLQRPKKENDRDKT